ncbi:MAG TPA: hypothetical protein DCE41_33450 [Cytophagales bacterium]|nr:hypothetical protein [Cytophagales bacterium]HAA19398.1 hypothetical protein [Cytophagales bacterium]HAP61271.1 hypothetical protein [Cytophagales bacterium]
MRITLDINDPQAEEFLSLIKSLDYVSIAKDATYTPWQEEETARRLQQITEGNMSVRPWSEAKEDLFQ